MQYTFNSTLSASSNEWSSLQLGGSGNNGAGAHVFVTDEQARPGQALQLNQAGAITPAVLNTTFSELGATISVWFRFVSHHDQPGTHSTAPHEENYIDLNCWSCGFALCRQAWRESCTLGASSSTLQILKGAGNPEYFSQNGTHVEFSGLSTEMPNFALIVLTIDPSGDMCGMTDKTVSLSWIDMRGTQTRMLQSSSDFHFCDTASTLRFNRHTWGGTSSSARGKFEIDDLRVYRGILSSAQIQGLFADGPM